MKKIIFGAVLGAGLVALGVFLSDLKRHNAASTSGGSSPVQSDSTNISTVSVPPQEATSTNWQSLSLAEHLRSFLNAKPKLTSEVEQSELEILAQRTVKNAPELDVLEVVREGAISMTLLATKHSGQVYKLSGLILESGKSDVTIVIQGTEVVCSYADPKWKDGSVAPGKYLYAAGVFESLVKDGTKKHIVMANCYPIERFSSLKNPTLDQQMKALDGFKDDAFHKLGKDLNADILLRGGDDE